MYIEQYLRPIFLTEKESRERYIELVKDPMGTIIAVWALLGPDMSKIISSTRRKYGFELVPTNYNERMRFIKNRWTQKAWKKVWKEIYKLVGETNDIIEVNGLADKYLELGPALAKFIQPIKKKGRPKKADKYYDWPQADITNTLAYWAIYRIVWPLPEYFYNPQSKLSIEGMPITFAISSSFNENYLQIKNGQKSKPLSKKRERETLFDDAYYWLIRYEGQKIRTYTDIATYVLEEGSYETQAFETEEEEEIFRKKLSKKIAEACRQFDQYCRSILQESN